MNQPKITTPPPIKSNGKEKPASGGKAVLGCLLHPFWLIFYGLLLLLFNVSLRAMDADYFDPWMERDIKANKMYSGIGAGECDYEGCSNEASWYYNFIPFGDLELPDNPNYPSMRSHSYTDSEKHAKREENTYLVPDGDKIKVETKKEWVEYETPVTKHYDGFHARYCEDHKDAAQKIIWDTVYWTHYRNTYIAMAVGGVLTVVGLVLFLVMRARKKKADR